MPAVQKCKDQDQLINAVIYARYSSHNQTEQSIEGQLHDAYEYAGREGYTVIGEYIDRAQSGTRDTRQQFQQMIEDAAKKQFSVILVWKLDRFARNRYDSAIYKAKLKKFGVRVVSVMERIQDCPEGIILEGMLESMAEYYSANLSVNIRRGQRETIAKGRYCGGSIAYGYRCVDGHLVPDPQRAPVIREVFRRYAEGDRMKDIIEDLSRRGVRSASGSALTHNTFSRALLNRVYLGEYTYKGQLVPGLADPLIDESTFQAVQRRVQALRHAQAAGRAKERYLLQGKCFCGHCGGHMIGESGVGKTGAFYSYYSCRNRKAFHVCKKRIEKKDFIEWYITEQTVEYVLSPQRIGRIAKAVAAEYEKEFSASAVTEKERELRRIERDLGKLVDALTEAPKAAQPRIFSRMEELEAQKADIEIDVAKLRVAMGIRLTEAEVLAWMRQFCQGDPLDPEFRRKIIDVFVNSVYLYDDRVIVFYNIKGGKQVSYIDLSDELESQFPDFSASPPGFEYDHKSSTKCDRTRNEPKIIFVNGILGVVYER